MTKQKVDWKVLTAVVVVLGAIQIGAMAYGINGTFRAMIVGLIALIAGIVIPKEKITG